MKKRTRYSRVYVLCSELERDTRTGEIRFRETDTSGFLKGHLRVEAANLLITNKRATYLIVVGSAKLNNLDEVEYAKQRIYGAKRLEGLYTAPDTKGNGDAIVRHLRRFPTTSPVGVLSNFYHLPRALRFLKNASRALIPISAESVLLAYDAHRWEINIRKWYHSEEMVNRLLSEISGLAALETDTYVPLHSRQ